MKNWKKEVEDSFLYALRGRDMLWDRPWCPGGRLASSSLFGAYLQNYTIYGYEILWVDRISSRGSAVHMNLNPCLLNFWVIALCLFHILSGAYLQNYTRYGYGISLVDKSHQGEVQCRWAKTLACLIFELLPFIYFFTWILSGPYFQNILAVVMKFCGWIDLIKWGVQCTWTLTIACLIFQLLHLRLFSYLNFVWCISPKLY